MKLKAEIRNPKSERRKLSGEVRIRISDFGRGCARERASTFIIVLWIAFGLVSLTVYFASSMSFELHASDNRVCGLAAEEAIEGAARYVGYLLSNLQTNGAAPDPTTYQCQAVPVSDAHFWLIGRGDGQGRADQLTFGLIDEASKLNLNVPSTKLLAPF